MLLGSIRHHVAHIPSSCSLRDIFTNTLCALFTEELVNHTTKASVTQFSISISLTPHHAIIILQIKNPILFRNPKINQNSKSSVLRASHSQPSHLLDLSPTAAPPNRFFSDQQLSSSRQELTVNSGILRMNASLGIR